MSYTVTNFKTKKALKFAVEMFQMSEEKKISDSKCLYDLFLVPIRCYNPGLGPDLSNFTGKICLEGPHYPAAHTWYAEAWLEDGKVVKVK